MTPKVNDDRMVDPARSKSFSVYLLKNGFDKGTALRADHKLGLPVKATALPTNADLYVFDGPKREPWWKLYFGVPGKLEQSTKAALLLLEAKNRTFAICFGNTSHNLEDESYEYDFGLRITLNCVDPEGLKNTDVSEPGAARRQRTQVSVGSDITYFDFGDSKVLRSLTGAVRPEFASLIKNVTGASNVRFTSQTRVNELPSLCEALLELYGRSDYLKSFPDVQNISPVQDPVLVEQLDANLLSALRSESHDPLLSVPEMLDFNDGFLARFTGIGASLLYSDVYLGQYYDHLKRNDFKIPGFTRDELQRQKLELLGEDGVRKAIYPIYKCLVFDTTLAGSSAIFHLMEGSWYRFEADYVKRLNNTIAPLFHTSALPDCTDHEEKDYNVAATAAVPDGVCLDRTNMSPSGNTQVEPCDVLFLDIDHVVFAHVKMSTASSELSHLFNQGANSMELFRSNDDVAAKLRDLIKSKSTSTASSKRILDALDAGLVRVDYVVVTHKPVTGGVSNLPLFSRISLSRAARTFRAMGVPVGLSFTADLAPDRAGVQKPRKPRVKKAAA